MILAGSETSNSGSTSGEGSQVYLCLSKEHRVSRSVRATWYLTTLLQDVPQNLFVKDNDAEWMDQSQDFGVLSAPPMVTPDTQLFFLCQQYSLVFILDLSDNMRTVSNHTHLVKVDSALSALHATLSLLTRPLHAPDSSVSVESELCVSVLAYCGTSAKKVIHVLLQGVYMCADNCPEMLDRIKTGVNQLELSLAQASTSHGSTEEQQSSSGAGGLVGDTGLEGMVKAGTLALQLLPRCALKGLVLLTDGVSGFSSPMSMHNTINSMRGANVSCWVVQVGGGPHPMDPLGHIPDTETLHFMTKACNGCVMDTNKIQEVYSAMTNHSPNAVQQSVLFWTFQRKALTERVRGVACIVRGVASNVTEWEDPFTPIIDGVFSRTTITTPLLCLVGCKIREGFFFHQVQLKESWLEVCLYYPWQPSVNIFYTIIAPWPVSEDCACLQVTISYEGPYSFVHDILDSNPVSTYSYRLAAIRKFKQALQKFSSSDALLAHFLSFPTTPTHRTLPQSVANGMPLFYFPPNQTKPAPSVSLDSSGGKQFSPLVNFWRPMCTIDTSQWFRWFHSNKVVLVLQQDTLLPSHLLNPAPSGRYATIQCRLSASHLYNFLKLWSSMALLENHSYIRFLPSSDSPKYFCVVRVAHVLPCVVLHVGHIQGTPHDLQSKTVTSLVTALKDLTVTPSERPLGALGRKRPSMAVKAKPSATVLDKQLQRVMIRYEGSVSSSSGTALSSLTHSEEMPVQMDYLSCTRWTYTVPQTMPTLLTALLRRRLKEGFLLSGSRNGVVSLIAQLTVKQPTTDGNQALLLQYVIFPFSEHPTSELWVEPQYGRVCATPRGLSYLSEATHMDIAHKIHNIDRQLLTSVSSFLYLQHRCQPNISMATLPHGSCDPICKSCDLVPSQLEVYPGSLFESSTAIVLTLEAFSEDSTDDYVDLDHCSQLNEKLWNNLYQWLSHLAPIKIPALTNTHTLLTRVTSSHQLKELKCSLSASTATEWKYFVLSQDDTVCQLYLPDMFYSTGDGAFVLPLVIMDCQLANLIDPDPMVKEPPTKPPDLHLHRGLAARQPTPADMRESLDSLLFSLDNAHLSSYLEVVRVALTTGLDVTPQDFHAALKVCSHAAVSVDLTPLLAAFCPHSGMVREEGTVSAPLDTPTLSALLDRVVSRKSWQCAVRVAIGNEDEVFFKHWGEETRAAICKSLTDCQFRDVPRCSGYYYWREQSATPKEDKTLPPVLSPVSEASTVARPTEDLPDPTPHETTSDLPSIADDVSSCSSEEMDIDPLLSSDDEGDSSLSHAHTHTSPLFLNVTFSVRNKTTEEITRLSHDIKASSCDNKGRPNYIMDTAPLCMKPLQGKLLPDCNYFVAMEMDFLSFTPASFQDKRSEVNEVSEDEGLSLMDQGPLSSLPQQYQSTAHSLQQKLEWLVADELVSIGRSATPISQPLLQAVVAHVQRTQSDKCFSRRVPLRFVFGSNHSMSHFLQELEAFQVPNYAVSKTEDYYYLSVRPHPPSHAHYEPPLSMIGEEERSKTPPPVPVQPRSRVHRRSLSSGYPRGHTPKGPPPSDQPESIGVSAEGSRESVVESVSGYEASQSCSLSSVSIAELEGPIQDGDFWAILRPLPDLVELSLQVRSCHHEGQVEELTELSTQLEGAISRVCHRTNQWFLLKELLDTRMCSPYLLSESASEAWVDDVVSKQESKDTREVFRGQEFMCDIQWKRYITPHWRLKSKGAQTAVLITRSALNVHSVSNRLDVYVLQDVSPTGEESIFYLKIDESLCRVEDDLNESLTTADDPPRPDTRATVEGAETMSTVSISHSISEMAPELDKKVSIDGTPTQGSGKPQESLVLQLYGIKAPSHDLTDRLNRLILFKLDDAVLEAMCSLYARNQRLRLYPADVQFLQPTISEPSHILSLPLPIWATSVEAVVFYFLQNFSALTLQPNYMSRDHRDHFQVPLELQNAYLAETCDDSHEIHQDHLFLYIRPHHKGRGMAVISISLVSPEGRMMTPLPGVIQPSIDYPNELEETGIAGMQCSITEIPSEIRAQYSIQLHVWEKGNIGLTEFMDKVLTCFKHTLIDYVMELHLLHLPVATSLKDEDGVRDVSPYVLIDFRTERKDSLNDELETVVEEGATYQPPSRRVSRESRKGSSDVRRASNDSRRGSNDTRQGSRKSSEDLHSRKTSTASDTGRLERSLIDMESLHSPVDKPQRSRAFTEQIMDRIKDAMEGSTDSKQRQEQEAWEAEKMDTHLGNKGLLSSEYESLIPQHLAEASRLKALSVRHHMYKTLGSYSAKVLLSQMVKLFTTVSADLTVNVFASNPGGQLLHFDPPQDWTKIVRHIDSKLKDVRFVLIGRNLTQFQEGLRPESRSTKPWVDQSTNLPLQLFQPLDCLKDHKNVPLQHMPIAADAFVPRQRLVLATLTSDKVHVWLYNFSDESSKRVSDRLTKVAQWQSARVGLTQQLLTQKLGLFQHTQARDIQPTVKLAVKHSPAVKEMIQLVRNNSPVDSETPLSARSRYQLQRPVMAQESPLLESLYQNTAPQAALSHTEDPVYNHGRQLAAHVKHQKINFESQELLGRVFTSWQSRISAPVNAASISALKRMSRLLHHCSSPVLSGKCTKNKGFTEAVKESVLTQYIEYLQTLGFQTIAERSSTSVAKQRPPPAGSYTHSKLYKCLQRWWAGGIILAELCFQDDDFLVKLFSLEASRLLNQTTLTPESQSQFSLECARYRDFIHVHSFMMDFHLRLLLDYLSSAPPENFDLRVYLSLCHNKTPTHFARNVIQRGGLDIATPSVAPAVLYQYLMVHSAMLGGRTMELKAGGTARQDVGLLIEVTADSLGPVTSPQLSRLMEDGQGKYHISVVVLLRLPEGTDPVLGLDYYLILVYKDDSHPRLIGHTPALQPTCHALPLGDPENEGEDVSEFNLKVREHRRRMGLLSTPSPASQLTLHTERLTEHVGGVRLHLEEACHQALSHMRRDGLWKRMVYGQVPIEGGRTAHSPLEGLTCSEFRELVRLVTVVPLNTMDQRLQPLKRQSKKWFKRLMRPLQVRFSEHIKLYVSEDDTYTAAAIVNPDWQDMCVLIQVDKDSHSVAAVYRHQREGGVPSKERLLTANVEAERAHIETIVNFMCSFLWASILDTSPPQPQLNLL